MYNPARISDVRSSEELRQYVEQELEKISKEFNETIALDLRTVHQEPKRPRDGMIVSADGSDWNPGAGAGAYEFVNGVWRRAFGLQAGDYGDVTVDGSGNIAIDNNAVTLAKLADIATARILGRVTAGTGDPEELTGAQATTLLGTFTNLLKGLAPASGGGTTNFLRADGSWAVPATSSVYKEDVSLSGAAVAIDNIPAHDTIFIHVNNASHNAGAGASLQVELSDNNGSSYATAIVVSASVSSAIGVFALIQISSNSVANAHYVNAGTLGGIITSFTGAINAIRLSFTSGSFDNGTALLVAPNV